MDRKHVFIMLLCCLAPILAIGAIFVLQVPVSTVLLLALVLICPLSHLLMMKFTGHEHASTMDASHSQVEDSGGRS